MTKQTNAHLPTRKPLQLTTTCHLPTMVIISRPKIKGQLIILLPLRRLLPPPRQTQACYLLIPPRRLVEWRQIINLPLSISHLELQMEGEKLRKLWLRAMISSLNTCHAWYAPWTPQMKIWSVRISQNAWRNLWLTTCGTNLTCSLPSKTKTRTARCTCRIVVVLLLLLWGSVSGIVWAKWPIDDAAWSSTCSRRRANWMRLRGNIRWRSAAKRKSFRSSARYSWRNCWTIRRKMWRKRWSHVSYPSAARESSYSWKHNFSNPH